MEWAMCYSLGGVAEFSEFSWLAGFSFLSVLHCKNCCEVEIASVLEKWYERPETAETTAATLPCV